jgi:hypothetical protein
MKWFYPLTQWEYLLAAAFWRPTSCTWYGW